MVNAFSPQAATTVRCRQIGEADIEAVTDLLTRGFPGRQVGYWRAGLARMAAADIPDGCPRFGYMMENAGRPVGVILTLYRNLPSADGKPYIRCNLSSWYVEPAFRSYASPLVYAAIRKPNVTYVNISPAPPTWSTVEAQGFTQFGSGLFFAVPALRVKGKDQSVIAFSSQGNSAVALPPGEAALLADHARLGCCVLLCRTPQGDRPFVFLPFRIRAGRVRLPCVRLIYCRDMADFEDCAGVLGRYLLARGIISTVIDVETVPRRLRGFYTQRQGHKYYKGPQPQRLGDLAYSELVFFGP